MNSKNLWGTSWTLPLPIRAETRHWHYERMMLRCNGSQRGPKERCKSDGYNKHPIVITCMVVGIFMPASLINSAES